MYDDREGNSSYFTILRRKAVPIAVFSFLFASVIQVVGLIPVMMMPDVIDRLIPEGQIGKIMFRMLFFCGIPLGCALLYDGYQYYLMVQSKKLIAWINQECFDKLIHQPMCFFDENHSAELAGKASQDAVSYIAVWTIDIPKLLSGLLVAVFTFGMLWRIHMVLAVFQLAYFPFALLLMRLVGDKLQYLIDKVVENNAKYEKQMQEAFRNIRLVKSMRLEKEMGKRVSDIQNAILKVWGKVAFLDNFSGSISNTLMPGIFYGATFIISAVLASMGWMSVGCLTASLGYASKIHATFGSLISTYKGYKKAKGELSAMEGYLAMKDERDTAGEKPWKFEKEIIFEKVSFSYPAGGNYVLRSFSLKIPKGTWIGLYGVSGAGKSTVLELLLRFYEVEEGKIYVDENGIEDINLYALRSHISYVPQEPVLLQGSIRDNLLLENSGVSEEELREAAEKTGITDWIEGGLDKEVGEAGMLLSGGERQRVAIARCLLEKKPVILLDEATSQLDGGMQKRMAELFDRERKRRDVTIVSVAHRREFHCFVDREIAL